MDSVISQTHEHLLEYLKKSGRISDDIIVDDIKCWGLEYNSDTGEGIPGLNREDLDNVFMTPEFWKTIPVFQNTVEAMQKLNSSCNIYIITDRRWFPELEQITRDWLESNDVPYDGLILSKGSEKYVHCMKNKIRFFIDDNESNIQSIAPYVQCAYLHARPWNVNTILPENAVRPQCIEETVQDILTYNYIEGLSHRINMSSQGLLLSEKAQGKTRTPRITIGDTTTWRTLDAA